MSKPVLIVALVLVVLALWLVRARAVSAAASAPEKFPVQLSDEEWKSRLPEPAYRILRHESTERPGTSPLDHEMREGEFRCAGCQNVLFSSSDKFNSGTGWPSFVRPANEKSVGSKTDYALLAPRTEVHCSQCGGHLGHLFSDGPTPTGKRYCINGGALTFVPKEEILSH